jgi:mRNA-degrading endonuclease RelE of RelBE toxin-antitoxin system
MMEFRIADTFAESLSRLTGDEQKSVKTTAFDLQMHLGSPGMRFHRLEKGKDRNFWSVRVNEDLRIIVHRTSESVLLCYVNHHDEAYRWAERRRLEVHPKTGAAQLVEIRERVEEIVVPKSVEAIRPVQAKPPLFSAVSDDVLLSFGVPAERLADVHSADENSLLELAGHLPGEAAEALLNLATGVAPRIPQQVALRYRTVCNAEELECALEYPWEK